MIARRRRSVVAVMLASAAITLAACSAPPAPEPAPSQPAAAPSEPAEPSPEPSASTPTAVDTSCTSILPADTVADFEVVGWTAQETPFYAGSIELTGGMQCTWGDFTVATDHVQIYGWAPITDAVSNTAQEELLSSGWRGEESPDGIYITESADTAIATDDEGYGITYLFGDGWVTISDTKQGLVLIERPES